MADPCKQNPTTNLMLSISPNYVVLMDSLTSTTNEISFKDFDYYVRIGQASMWLTPHDVVELILNYNSERRYFFPFLVMENQEGEQMAGHLPNIGDMAGRMEVSLLRERLAKLVEEDPGIPSNYAKFFDNIVDPEPYLRIDQPIYSLNMQEMVVDIRSDTDSLRVYAVDEVMSTVQIVVKATKKDDNPNMRFHRIAITPTVQEGEVTIGLGEKIVIWNGRGIARPSFLKNLSKLIDAFSPTIMVITEARVSNVSMMNIFEGTGFEFMQKQLDETTSLEGGTLILSHIKRARVELSNTISSDEEIRFTGQIKGPAYLGEHFWRRGIDSESEDV